MAAPKHSGDAYPAHQIDADVDFTGYDPYIVALTGGASAPVSSAPSIHGHATESRKVKLMAWLREHGA